MAEPSPPDVVFEGNSLSVIRGFPAEVRENLGADLRRLQNGERPLDSGSMSPALPAVFELRDQDKATWYRVFYAKMGGRVYVLHCFTKKTNQTPKGDIEIGRKRLSDLKARLAKQKKQKPILNRKERMTKDVFEDLGFSPEEAAALKLKTDLHTKIVKSTARYSQKQLQTLLDESQPRVSDLLRGKMSKFSLEMLVIYAEKLGLRTEIKTTKARSRRAGAGLALML